MQTQKLRQSRAQAVSYAGQLKSPFISLLTRHGIIFGDDHGGEHA